MLLQGFEPEQLEGLCVLESEKNARGFRHVKCDASRYLSEDVS